MNAPSTETVVLSPVTDDEREDGEIVDDDLEDISDYSIPSSGKSEYSERLIRAISLSSLSGSDGERVYCDRKLLVTALAADGVVRSSRRHKKARRKSGSRTKTHTGSRKRHRDGRDTLSPAQSRARKHRRKSSYSRSASISSNSNSDIERHVIDTRTLRRLNKAVRIETNATEEISHKSLKDRLQRMIHPLTPEVIKSSNFNISFVHVDSKISNSENARSLDDTHDKELEELRSQALKSAMLKKHMERKKRKEALNNKQSSNLLQVNDKENESSNPILTETRTIERVIDLDEHDLPEKTNEDDLDIMRAMLLASMSTKITTEQPSRSPDTTNSPQNALVAISNVTKSSSSSPIPLEFLDKKKPAPNFSEPPVKPLIIRANYDSESDTDFEFEDDNKRTSHVLNKPSVVNKIETSVDEFLRKQREQFEAKLVEDKVKDSLLNKSFLKLLPQSQQEEYTLLQQKLLEAKKIKTKSKTKQLIATTSTRKDIPSTTEEMTKKDKKDRLHPKGKYRELAPLVRKINAEVAAQRREEQNMKRLMKELQAARYQVAVHQKRHIDLVGQLKKTRALIDLRWQKSAKTKALEIKKMKLEQETKQKHMDLELGNSMKLKPVDIVTVSAAVQNGNIAKSIELNDVTKSVQIGDMHSAIEDKNTNVNKIVTQEQIVLNGTFCETREIPEVEESVPTKEVTDTPESPLSYVSPLDRRETNSRSNPLQMLCPYELFGVCKDPACTFNHCP